MENIFMETLHAWEDQTLDVIGTNIAPAEPETDYADIDYGYVYPDIRVVDMTADPMYPLGKIVIVFNEEGSQADLCVFKDDDTSKMHIISSSTYTPQIDIWYNMSKPID